ncbi:hypothetical protein PR048_001856 [Dryococelus australis]|uniref:CCHC-type domain-containing protein n=1 Tax=Dryococelus australis TaxID=614101 RepID=A0ABQ9IJ82_9NEOP|nr:hypothetical protein PR048_001856 [Dryococelus australis]
MSQDGEKSGKFRELSNHEQEKHSLFNLGDSLSAENMAVSQELAKALTMPQMAEWMRYVGIIENKPEYTTRLRLAGRGTVADGPQREAAIRARVFEENRTAVEVFLKGLRPSIQRFVLSRSSKRIEKDLQYTEEEAQNEQMSSGINYAQNVEDWRSQVRGGIRPPAENRRAGDSKCFNCGRTNHLVRECFEKKREEIQTRECEQSRIKDPARYER